MVFKICFRRTAPNGNTYALIRTPDNVIKIYRCLQILIRMSNVMFRELMWYCINLIMILVLACNVVLLSTRIRNESPIWMLWIIFMVDLFCLPYLMGMYLKLGEVHESSKKFVNSWKKNCGLTGLRKKLFLKRIKSCRLIRFELSSVGFVRKAMAGRVITKIAYYTNKLLIVIHWSLYRFL